MKTGFQKVICRREIESALPKLLKYAYALTRDGELAAELVQETVVKALSTKRQPARAEEFRPWLFAILRNAHIDHLRRTRRLCDLHETVDEIDDLPQTSASRFEDTIINRLSVQGAFMRLQDHHRDILALVDIAGFTYAETSEILGIPRGTVMSRLSRARNAMMREIAGANREIAGANVHSLETAREARKASAR